MASLPIYDKSGSEVGSYEIDHTELAPQINKQLLHDVVVMFLANQRQGSFGSKTRAEVAGSTKKLYRQKGTGNARMGSKRAGQRRGGGHIFAKRPRDFSYKMPRKAVQAATRMAIAGKLRDNEVVVIDDLSMGEPKTKDFKQILKALNLDGTSTLVTTEGHNVNVYKSARNLQGVAVSPAAELNAYTVLRQNRMLVTKSALDALRAKAAGNSGSDEG